MALRAATLCILLCVLASGAPALTGYHGYYVKDVSASFRFYDIPVPRSTSITIDGVLSPGEGWDLDGPAVREIFKFDRRDARIAVALAWDDTNLYLAVEAQDDLILEDASGDSFLTSRGDNVEIYIDTDLSRDSVLQTDDYVLAFTLGPTKPHVRFDRGTGGGGTQFGGVDVPVVRTWYQVALDGTLNDTSGTASGWTAEARIPWSAMGVSAPAHGDLFGVAPIFLECDDSNVGCDTIVYDESGWDEPFEINRFYKLSGDGLQGPDNYMRAYVVDLDENTAPEAIDDLGPAAASEVGSFSIPIEFTAPGDDGSTGWCHRYEIRTAPGGPISGDAAWDAASVYENVFRPQRAGETEAFEILGLTPGTSYGIAVRCRDHADNLAGHSNGFSAATAPAPADPLNHGFARISPAGPYLVRQDGTPLVAVGDHMAASWRLVNTAYNGLMWNPTSGILVNWQTCQNTGGDCGSPDVVLRDYFRNTLAANGVNVMRLFLEDLTLDGMPVPVWQNGLPYLEFPASTTGSGFNLPTIQDYLDDILRIAKDEGIYVILVTFDTFFYESRFDTHFAYNQALGGIAGVNDPNDLFTNATARQAMEKRLEVIAAWSLEGGDYTVATHPNVLYVDILNEWDGADWSTTPSATRMTFLQNFLPAARAVFPNHLLAASSVEWQPQNEKADFVLNGDGFDLIDIHTYTKANRDPKATGAGDSNLTIRGALEAQRMVKYQQGNSVGHRPVFVSEFAHIETFIAGYDGTWTEAVDTDQTHNMFWMQLTSGAANAGLRFPGIALAPTGPLLPAGMRDFQRGIAAFIQDGGIRYDGFAHRNWDHHLTFADDTETVFARGVFSETQGVVYLLQDLRESAGVVSGGQLTIENLAEGGTQPIEVVFRDPWDVSPAPATSTTNAMIQNGTLTVTVPDFTRGTVVVVPEPRTGVIGLVILGLLGALRLTRRLRAT